MSRSSGPWRTQVASDVIRDGLGVELLDGENQIAAEVFLCDADPTVSASLFVETIPLHELEMLMARAKERLDQFGGGVSFGGVHGE